MARPWRPILDGEPAERAGRLLRDLLAALRVDEPADDARTSAPTLNRLAGRALLWHYADCALPADGFAAEREAALDAVCRGLQTTTLGPQLFSGFVGAAWVLDHVAGEGSDEIDAALAAVVAADEWHGDFDWMTGLAGIGAYALARVRRGAAHDVLAGVVAWLERLAEPRGGGVAWHSKPEQRPSPEHWPTGYYSYGVAHGTPAVALVLAGAVRAGVVADRARPLLDGALRWLWAGRRADPSQSTFDLLEHAGGRLGPGPLGWCYGDTGVAATLLATASAVGDREWAARALAVARASTERTFANAGVVDPNLCHGAAGLGLLYARLFYETGDAACLEASRRWYLRLVEGFEMPDETSLLTGTTGIALSLVSALAPVEPAWDEVLAASCPGAESLIFAQEPRPA